MLKPKHLRLLVLLGVTSASALVVFIFFPSVSDLKCVALLTHSESDEPIPLPANCLQTAEVPVDSVVKDLENERHRRGLIFKQWITCKTPDQPANLFAFEHDARWLPSYAPESYQFRRTVVVLRNAVPAPQGSSVVAEVALMPWRMYFSQVAGQCDGKFSVWR